MSWRDETLTQIDEIQKEIDGLVKLEKEIKDRLSRLRSERDYIRRHLCEPPTGRVANGREDEWSVKACELASVIESWARRFGEGAYAILSERSGIHARAVRRIRGSGNQQRVSGYTTLGTAELLLRAMDEENAIRDGRIKVVPNPYRRPPETNFWED